MSDHHVCPWWLAYTFDNPLRRLIHNPRDIFSGYVKEGMTVMDVGCGMGYFTLGLAELGPGPKIILRGTDNGSYRCPFFTFFTNLICSK